MNLCRGAGYAEGATEKTNETTNTPFSLEITEQKIEIKEGQNTGL